MRRPCRTTRFPKRMRTRIDTGRTETPLPAPNPFVPVGRVKPLPIFRRRRTIASPWMPLGECARPASSSPDFQAVRDPISLRCGNPLWAQRPDHPMKRRSPNPIWGRICSPARAGGPMVPAANRSPAAFQLGRRQGHRGRADGTQPASMRAFCLGWRLRHRRRFPHRRRPVPRGLASPAEATNRLGIDLRRTANPLFSAKIAVFRCLWLDGVRFSEQTPECGSRSTRCRGAMDSAKGMTA